MVQGPSFHGDWNYTVSPREEFVTRTRPNVSRVPPTKSVGYERESDPAAKRYNCSDTGDGLRIGLPALPHPTPSRLARP